MAAKSKPIVYLGYPDEQITERNSNSVDFTTNKIGGKPIWLNETDFSPSCQICGLNLVIVVQLYAPLENSIYHRCLYVYGCINPSCWNQSKSWVCLCSQRIDNTSKSNCSQKDTGSAMAKDTAWCDEADDWGSDDQMDEEEDDLNGNLDSDFNKLKINENNKVDNGASSISVMGAFGQTTTPVATAEIEEDESGVVEVESPVDANVNVVSLLLNVTPVPQVSSQKFQFIPLFLSFEEETFDSSPDQMSDHVNALLQNYHRTNPMDNEMICSQNNGSSEGYEKGLPMHGDKLFHRYLTRIKRNPGQVIRYCRDNSAVLWIQPTEQVTARCKYCKGPLVFEIQLLSTLIPCLSLQLSECGSGESDHLEFGCVYIFTCAANCWNDDLRFKEEFVLIQSEVYN